MCAAGGGLQDGSHLPPGLQVELQELQCDRLEALAGARRRPAPAGAAAKARADAEPGEAPPPAKRRKAAQVQDVHIWALCAAVGVLIRWCMRALC